MSNISKKKLRLFIILFAIIALITTAVFIILKKNNQTQLSNYDNELLRTMSYEQFVDGDEAVDNTDNVKFSSFFLRDLDGDGYAEKIKGTCKEVGAEDTLYMEIIVQTAGYLKDAKIDINGQNFYLQTALPKDNELKENYIGNNIKKIEFEQLNNGTQKLLTGIVKSGDYSKYDAIGNNVRTDFEDSDLKTLMRLLGVVKMNEAESVSVLTTEDGDELLTTGMISGISYVYPVAGKNDYSELKEYLDTRLIEEKCSKDKTKNKDIKKCKVNKKTSNTIK